MAKDNIGLTQLPFLFFYGSTYQLLNFAEIKACTDWDSGLSHFEQRLRSAWLRVFTKFTVLVPSDNLLERDGTVSQTIARFITQALQGECLTPGTKGMVFLRETPSTSDCLAYLFFL